MEKYELTRFVLAIGIGLLGTGAVYLLVNRLGILDVPNERSSHDLPTPTLGGVGIILGVWGALLVSRDLPEFWEGLLFASVLLILLVCDEVRPKGMGRLAKLAVQLGTAGVMVGSGVVLSRIYLPGLFEVDLAFWGVPLTFCWLVGIQNLYNFMDGIDAIAGLEGLLVAGLWAGIVSGLAHADLGLSLALAGASLGFLFWNFPPARIFMGDAGSNFLGLSLGVLAVLGDAVGLPFGVSLLLLGAFLFDTIYTLARRLLRGENITKAHRFHLYQRLNRMGWSPLWINAFYGLCTLLLGGVAHLWIYGHPHLAFRASVGMLGLMGLAAVWVEWRWKARKSVEL